MNNEEQLSILKEIKADKRVIMKIIENKNIELIDSGAIEIYLKELHRINKIQQRVWRERHKEQRKKYDNSDRAKELSRLRSKKNYQKRKKMTKAQ